MLLSNAIKHFLTGYFSTHMRSKKTFAAYSLDLMQFKEKVGRNLTTSSISVDMIENWALYLRQNNYAPASIRRKLATLRVFFHYWFRKKKIKTSPFWHFKIDLGNHRTLTKILTENEINQLLSHARQNIKHVTFRNTPKTGKAFLSLRNLAIIELLYNTGIRVGELASITLSDILLEERVIKINGKGGKERLAFLIDDYSFKTILQYINYRKKIETSHQALFINVFRTPISTQGIANILMKLSKEASITKHVTPHMIRHTAASLLLRNGADIRIVQEFLGHSSIISTQRYTHISKEHLVLSLKKLHPILILKK